MKQQHHEGDEKEEEEARKNSNIAQNEYADEVLPHSHPLALGINSGSSPSSYSRKMCAKALGNCRE